VVTWVDVQAGCVRGRETFDGPTDRWSRSDWRGVVLDAPDAHALAHFYSDLLGWEISTEGPDGAAMGPSDGVTYLAVQTAPDYVRPVWPAAGGVQQMMMHLDFELVERVGERRGRLSHMLESGHHRAQRLGHDRHGLDLAQQPGNLLRPLGKAKDPVLTDHERLVSHPAARKRTCLL